MARKKRRKARKTGKTTKRRKARKSTKRRKKASAGGWSPAKLRAYKAAKRRLIKAFDRKGATGSVSLSVG